MLRPPQIPWLALGYYTAVQLCGLLRGQQELCDHIRTEFELRGLPTCRKVSRCRFTRPGTVSETGFPRITYGLPQHAEREIMAN